MIIIMYFSCIIKQSVASRVYRTMNGNGKKYNFKRKMEILRENANLIIIWLPLG